MIFAHDTEVALAAAAALVNTARVSVSRDSAAGDSTVGDGPAGDAAASGEPDGLPDIAALDQFVGDWGWTGDRTRDQAEFDAVRALRPRLARLWECDADQAADLVNSLLKESRALPQLVKHDDWDYHIHATPPEAPLADRMAVEAAMAFADVIRSGQLDRLRECAAEDCRNLYVDLSKNSSRRFCGTACANRVNVAAYRNRRAADSAADSGAATAAAGAGSAAS
jgi:predicted RNA-binding Zn ribbon-like protein